MEKKSDFSQWVLVELLSYLTEYKYLYSDDILWDNFFSLAIRK